MVVKYIVLLNEYEFFIGFSGYIIGSYIYKIFNISFGCVLYLYINCRSDIMVFVFVGVIGCINSC